MKKFLLCVCIGSIFLSINAFSSDYTNWAIPSQVEVVQGGIVVSGNFGNSMECKNSNLVYYANTDVDYNIVVSMVLAAISAQKELRFYADGCKNISFHGTEVNKAKNGYGIYFK